MEINFVMFKPDGRRKDIPLGGSTTVIGRGEECDLRVPLLSVSRHHCQVSIEAGGLQVKDLGSSNGTYVNSNRVQEATLQAGDRLAVGPIVFTVQVDGIPSDITPVEAPAAASASAGDDEIIDLQVDMLDDGGSDGIIDLEGTEADDDHDLDPISALEALAAESDKKKNG